VPVRSGGLASKSVAGRESLAGRWQAMQYADRISEASMSGFLSQMSIF